jgi:hypothetical protein
MRFQQGAALADGRVAVSAQLGETLHVANRHAGRAQAL